MALRMKFRVTERADLYFSRGSKRLTFQAVADESIPASDRLTQGSPGATFATIVDNPAALEQLDLGAEVYFDISPAARK